MFVFIDSSLHRFIDSSTPLLSPSLLLGPLRLLLLRLQLAELVELALGELVEGPVHGLVALHAVVVLPVVLDVLQQIGVQVLDDALHRLVLLLVDRQPLLLVADLRERRPPRGAAVEISPLTHLVLLDDHIAAQKAHIAHRREEVQVLRLTSLPRAHLRDSAHEVQQSAVRIVPQNRHYASAAARDATRRVRAVLHREAVVLGGPQEAEVHRQNAR